MPGPTAYVFISDDMKYALASTETDSEIVLKSFRELVHLMKAHEDMDAAAGKKLEEEFKPIFSNLPACGSLLKYLNGKESISGGPVDGAEIELWRISRSLGVAGSVKGTQVVKLTPELLQLKKDGNSNGIASLFKQSDYPCWKLVAVPDAESHFILEQNGEKLVRTEKGALEMVPVAKAMAGEKWWLYDSAQIANLDAETLPEMSPTPSLTVANETNDAPATVENANKNNAPEPESDFLSSPYEIAIAAILLAMICIVMYFVLFGKDGGA